MGWRVTRSLTLAEVFAGKDTPRRCDDESVKMQRFKSARSAQRFLSMHPARTQHLQPSTPPRLALDVPDLPNQGGETMAECSRGSVIAHPALSSFCSTQVNLTMPSDNATGSPPRPAQTVPKGIPHNAIVEQTLVRLRLQPRGRDPSRRGVPLRSRSGRPPRGAAAPAPPDCTRVQGYRRGHDTGSSACMRLCWRPAESAEFTPASIAASPPMRHA
jgi:hypothetical protein